MLKSFRAKTTSVFFWAIVVLLIIGLAGIGIGGGGLGTPSVARVGDREVDRDAYLRALDAEMRAIGQQLGRPLTTAEARQFGVDRFVLARLVNEAALDHEAARIGISTGDDRVSRQIQATPAFQGLDGSFDRDAYRFGLDRAGYSVRDFEESVRREATRELIAASLQSPAAMPEAAALTVLGFLGERRSFDYVSLGPEHLAGPLPAPTEEALAAFHAANPLRYTRPEKREITYARLTLDDLAPTIEVPEAEVDAALVAAPGRFDTPERRFLERIGFAAEAEAEAARRRLDAGEISFDALAAERELAPLDIDLGLLAASDLAQPARDAVFGLTGPGVAGPVATPLGPSLYRVNGIVAGETLPPEEARARIRDELALSAARERMLGIGRELEDLVAGGATVEEIAAETPLVPGGIALSEEAAAGGLADDADFRAAALAAGEGFETDPVELADGSIAVLRVDAVLPPALMPLGEVRERVGADWAAEAAAARLAEQAEGLRAEVAASGSLDPAAQALGTPVRTAGPVTRGEIAEALPPALVAEIFAVEPGQTVVLPQPGGAILALLAEVEPFDPATPENRPVVDSVQAELRRQLGDDMLAYATRALQLEAGVSVNESVVESTLSALP